MSTQWNVQEADDALDSETDFLGGGLKLRHGKRLWKERWRTIALFVCLIAGLPVGIAVGHYLIPCANSHNSAQIRPTHMPKDLAGKISNISADISATNIMNNLRSLTLQPHIAGSQRNLDLALSIQSSWKQNGLDKVELFPYNVLLSYPDPDRPNQASVLDGNGAKIYSSEKTEPTVSPDESDPNVSPPFNAYSASGAVKGELVFVNYAQREDFGKLAEAGINVTGQIAIARYGQIFRGNKAANAEHSGAVGLIMYSDPADYAQFGHSAKDTYPNTQWLPPGGVQRGSVFLGQGDPLRPIGIPALPGAFQYTADEIRSAGNIPRIPVMPMSYGDAYEFLRRLGGPAATTLGWKKGNLSIPYNVGPGFLDEFSNQSVLLNVTSHFVQKSIYNVVGTIHGQEEPDRVIMFGNHRDAWVFGGVDPSSGTACLLEIGRVLGAWLTKGWRPRRTIKLSSWDAEEYGLIGSTEYAKQFAQAVSRKTVAYLNVDVAVEGNFSFSASASPILNGAVLQATSMVDSPFAKGKTVADIWQARDSRQIRTLGSGTDYAAFMQWLGVSSTSFFYQSNPAYHISYPVYHSVHDTFTWMQKFADPTFAIHQALSRVWLTTGLLLAEQVIVPMNCTDYAEKINKTASLFKTDFGSELKQHGIDLGLLDSAVGNFSSATKLFMSHLQAINTSLPLAVRHVNDQLMLLDRVFLNQYGLPGRPFMRHQIFAPGLYNSYAGSLFPGVSDALSAKTVNWQTVQEQYSRLVITIQQAAEHLTEAY